MAEKENNISTMLLGVSVSVLIITLIFMPSNREPEMPDLHCRYGDEVIPLINQQLVACYQGCVEMDRQLALVVDTEYKSLRPQKRSTCFNYCDEEFDWSDSS
jgi:hypothetical protein